MLEAAKRFALGGPSESDSRSAPRTAARQLLGSLLLKHRANLFCLSVIGDFMCKPEDLFVVSKDALQRISIHATGFSVKSAQSAHSPGDLSGVVTSMAGALVSTSSSVFRLNRSLQIEQERSLPGYAPNILCIAATPDGSYFATGGGNAVVTVWSDQMEVLLSLTGHTDWVRFLKFAQQGVSALFLYSTGDDGVICQWDPATGALISHLNYGSGQPIQVFEVSFLSGLIAIACDKPLLAVYRCLSNTQPSRQGDNVLRLEQISIITDAHRSALTAARFTHDSRWIVSTGEDETLAVYSVEEPRRIVTCSEFVIKRRCITFMNTFSSICILDSPPRSSVMIVAACATDGTVVQWVVELTSGRTRHTKKLQLHVGALLSMDVVQPTTVLFGICGRPDCACAMRDCHTMALVVSDEVSQEAQRIIAAKNAFDVLEVNPRDFNSQIVLAQYESKIQLFRRLFRDRRAAQAKSKLDDAKMRLLDERLIQKEVAMFADDQRRAIKLRAELSALEARTRILEMRAAALRPSS